MNTRQRTGASFALVLLTAAPSPAQEPLDGFAEHVGRVVADWDVPGLAIAVAKDGELVFSQGFGVRELGSPGAVDEHTLFAIGSTTKAMTAAAIGMLVDDGELGWDDRVIEHLPEFRLHDPYVTREIRIRDLLTHRAGLGNADFLWYEVENSTGEILRRMRYVEPAYSFRAGFVYQNIMYVAAGEVVAAKSGMPWTEFLQQRIFDPLGMTESLPNTLHLAERSNVASPHDRVDGDVTVIENASVDAIAAAGAVWSSIHDMSKWMQFLLDGGKTETGKPLLSPETYAELFTPQTIVDRVTFYPTQRLTRPHWITYALGWFQHDYQGRALDFHTGSIDGMVAIHGLVRDERLGVCVLANLDHAEARHALMYHVLDSYGAGTERDWSTDLMLLYTRIRAESIARTEKREAERVTGTEPSVGLGAYAGTYSDALYGTVEVSVRDDALHFYFGPGLQGAMDHWHHDTFRVVWGAKWRGTGLVSFRLGQTGQPEELAVSGRAFRRVPEDGTGSDR